MCIRDSPTFDRGSGSGGGGSGDGSNSLEMTELSRSRRRSRNGESPPGYLDAVDDGSGDVTPDRDAGNSEAGTDDSDAANQNDNMADIDCLPTLPNGGGGAMRKVRSRGRRPRGPRVTFDDSVRGNDRRASGGGGGGGGGGGREKSLCVHRARQYRVFVGAVCLDYLPKASPDQRCSFFSFRFFFL